MNSQVSYKQIGFLLDELCVDLGFCLPPDGQAQLMNNPPADIDAFTDAVIRAEGLDPHADIPHHVRRDVRARVAKYFKSAKNDTPKATS